MTEISIETVTGKLNRVGYDAFIQALRAARAAGHRNVELAHWLARLLDARDSDLSLTVDHYGLDRGRLSADLARALESLRRGGTELPGVAPSIIDALDRGWHQATLLFGETQIRSGHLLVGALRSGELRRALLALSPEFGRLPVDALVANHRAIWACSEEENLQPMDGAGLVAGSSDAAGPAGRTALDRFSQDLTARAARGDMDPVRGRDEEIRQVTDVLMRRRQNNPILTGEAGVGKTAVVEGFAQAVVAGRVPPTLREVRVCALDIGLMQAGASMKGEFEQRLRAVIDEVQSSPKPIILFIDEAHTLIGAGGQAGTGDAANLLKPALARGGLRTIAATTWAEYRQHIEKDPALTRRFQPIHIGEPGIDQCRDMVRGLIGVMETHHGVRIAEAAIAAAVRLSHRYIPSRQLPDKAVSLLDTACARVAVSQNAVPAAVEDARAAIRALEDERAALSADRDLGRDSSQRLNAIATELATAQEGLADLEAAWAEQVALVEEIGTLRRRREAPAAPPDGITPAGEICAALQSLTERLDAIPPERRMVHAHVDEGTVAAIVSDWTGIPVGRMVRDEIETVLRLPEIIGARVVGQSHGLAMIARRVETNRAGLENPNKPVGVFLLCGPSGVGKTETALALAEALYGGEQNLITINMSEFQEAHTVSTLKGAPPGYVGHGEGGRLTEAVRRRPYSVVLLDEIEKAHPDVHELFFQVFDKGVMEDGTGRRIDFRNTLILMTSNVGTDLIMRAAPRADCAPHGESFAEAIAEALRPELLRVFPAALLGRIVTIPYLPLSPAMLEAIIRLQLDRIGARVRAAHGVAFSYDATVVTDILARCDDPDSGGRMIDNIVTNTLLPDLSRALLNRALARTSARAVRVTVADGAFVYAWDNAAPDAGPAEPTARVHEAA
ncbi:type VI secretion system ATPase TssH [Methylobacterium nodulans]|uniref:Type VI secretion ATPase, ClpV1 family n=1 Tax=Methylobacterium nodulans (strain LMG 21967 / CNCM I-2342 / ORS 2060) TaxID=460265 RepID=B8IIA8_METNO|nr:type VI secretion system ATPase TssH [Methylobacterium nodulans]ACL57977.1 type VI secretion ATPase, ClpV1 family [Methylobacterium nodulans ORS 2060]